MSGNFLVLFSDVELRLGTAQLQVVARDLGGHGDTHGLPVIPGGGHLGPGLFPQAARMSPEVDLPGGIEAGLPVLVGVGWRAEGGHLAVRAIGFSGIGGAGAEPRHQPRASDAECRPALGHARGGCLQIQAGPRGPALQAGQDRIIQQVPPGYGHRAAFQPGGQGTCVARLHLRRERLVGWRMECRTHGAAGQHQAQEDGGRPGHWKTDHVAGVMRRRNAQGGRPAAQMLMKAPPRPAIRTGGFPRHPCRPGRRMQVFSFSLWVASFHKIANSFINPANCIWLDR